jgi:hypothetical protein
MVERHGESSLPVGWIHVDLRVARPFDDARIYERRTAVLGEPGTGGVGCPAVQAALNVNLFGRSRPVLDGQLKSFTASRPAAYWQANSSAGRPRPAHLDGPRARSRARCQSVECLVALADKEACVLRQFAQ